MTTTAYTALLSEVLPYAHDCPQMVAVNAIRNAAIEFCQKSRIWQYDTPAITVTTAVSSYTLAMPTDTVLAGAMEVFISGRLIIPKSAEELTRIYRGYDWRTLSADPVYMLRTSIPTIVLVPVPVTTVVNGLTARVALAPTRSSTTFDGDLLEEYAEAIAKGALARLYATPGQPYENMGLAQAMMRIFMTKIGEARIKANKGQSRAAVAVEYQRWA